MAENGLKWAISTQKSLQITHFDLKIGCLTEQQALPKNPVIAVQKRLPSHNFVVSVRFSYAKIEKVK